MKNGRSLPSLTLLALCSLAACHQRAEAREPLPAPPYARQADGSLRVRDDLMSQLRFARVTRSGVRASLQGFGRVTFAPGASYAVRSPFSAFVERVLVNVGEPVTHGTPLAVLRSPEVARLRGEQRRIQADLDAARDDVSRLDRLVPQGAASERDLVAARARVSALSAELGGVRGALTAANASAGAGDAFVLRASAAGQVIARTIDPGERVEPNAAGPAVLIGDPAAVVVQASFPEREAPLLAAGEPCEFSVSALGADRFSGELVQVVQAVDPATHTATAICRPRVVDPRLRAEMVARVSLDVMGADVVTAPRDALLLRRDDRVMFVRRGAAVERRSVEVGATFGDRVQVLRGVRDGDEVIAENAVLLDGELDQLL